MKSRFEVGQLVVCTSTGLWYREGRILPTSDGPKHRSIYMVADTDSDDRYCYLIFAQWPDAAWNDIDFAPIEDHIDPNLITIPQEVPEMKHTFIKGQLVRCTRGGTWVDAKGIESIVPREGDACVVTGVHRHPLHFRERYVNLLGVKGYFNAELFEPIGGLSTVARCR